MLMPNGLMSYRIMKGRQDSKKYINILKECALPMLALNYGKNFIFQQDNCSIHISKEAKSFLSSNCIQTLEWPPISPDLNIIENVWSTLSEHCYKNGNPKNLKELIRKIDDAVSYLNSEKRNYIMTLYKSIPERLCSVLEVHGQRIKY